MKRKEVLYVPILNKNLLYISSLENKGFIVSFEDGEVIMWAKGNIINDADVIGFVYKLKGHIDSFLTASNISPYELWHIILAPVNYKESPIVRKVVTGLLEF